MKNRYLILLGCLLCSCNNVSTSYSSNSNTSNSEKSLDEIMKLAIGKYEMVSSNNTLNFEYAFYEIVDLENAKVQYKIENEDEVNFESKYYYKIADNGYNLNGKDIKLKFPGYDSGLAFPFDNNEFFRLCYTDDYEFSINVQSAGMNEEGYQTAKFIKI